MTANSLIPMSVVENRIFILRGQRIMIDRDLAELYGIPTKRLNEAVKRNIERFPEEFMFQLTNDEWNFLRSQFATFSKDIRKYKPYAFTDLGVAMLSSVLDSKQAIAVNIQIIKTFVRLRQIALSHAELAKELNELKTAVISYAEHNNADIEEIYRQLDRLNEMHQPSKIEFSSEVDR